MQLNHAQSQSFTEVLKRTVNSSLRHLERIVGHINGCELFCPDSSSGRGSRISSLNYYLHICSGIYSFLYANS